MPLGRQMPERKGKQFFGQALSAEGRVGSQRDQVGRRKDLLTEFNLTGRKMQIGKELPAGEEPQTILRWNRN